LDGHPLPAVGVARKLGRLLQKVPESWWRAKLSEHAVFPLTVSIGSRDLRTDGQREGESIFPAGGYFRRGFQALVGIISMKVSGSRPSYDNHSLVKHFLNEPLGLPNTPHGIQQKECLMVEFVITFSSEVFLQFGRNISPP